MKNKKQKLEDGIKIAKYILEKNPNDTWVQKGLIEMQKELSKIIEIENNNDKR